MFQTKHSLLKVGIVKQVIYMSSHRYIPFGLIALILACMPQDCVDLPSIMSMDSNAFDQRFGCMQISNASSALENLSPRLPVVECLFQGKDYNSQEGIVREGCMMPLFRRYLAKQGEDFKLISSREEFLSIFAPVETKEEALAFAVALTSSLPRYDTSVPEGYFPVTSSIRPTYAKETEGGYKVYLFDSELCGCGSHPYYAIEYLVTKAGNVTELSREKVYDSTSQICVD
jgi:hypothetical protein